MATGTGVSRATVVCSSTVAWCQTDEHRSCAISNHQVKFYPTNALVCIILISIYITVYESVIQVNVSVLYAKRIIRKIVYEVLYSDKEFICVIMLLRRDNS